MLAGHEEGNHHVGDLVVGDGGTVLVGRVHEMLHHVVLGVVVVLNAALLDGVHVDLGDGSLGVVTLAVPGERGPVKHEVDGGEAHVEVVVESGEGLVKLAADNAALEGVGGGENGDLGHLLGDINDARLALEAGGPLEVVAHFTRDDGNVGSEGLGGKSDLHELSQAVLAFSHGSGYQRISHLLLLHELGVGAVIDNILAKDGSGEDGVNLLSRDVLEFSVENKVVSGGAHGNGGFLAEEDKGEDIAELDQKVSLHCSESLVPASLYAARRKAPSQLKGHGSSGLTLARFSLKKRGGSIP